MPFTQGHALIIGVGSYEHEPRLNVPAATADARAVAQVLRDERFCGYPEQQVQLLLGSQATRTALLEHLDALARRCPADATVVLFYCGHGILTRDGSYYLAASDTRLSGRVPVPDTALSQRELLEGLRALRAARVLLIFNACHSGMLMPTLDIQANQELPVLQNLPDQTSAALLATGSGRAIMSACASTQFSYVGDGMLTIFTQALTAGLLGKGSISRGGYVSVFDLYNHVFETVRSTVASNYDARQEPELTLLQGVGPFPVALYQGARELGVFEKATQAAHGVVRQIDEATSKAAYERIVAVGQGIGVGGDLSGTAVAFGPQASINTPVTISAPISQGIVVGMNIGGTISNRVEQTLPAGAQPDTLVALMQELERLASAASTRGEDELCDDLHSVRMTLELAEKARRAGRAERSRAKIAEAQAGLQALLGADPQLAGLTTRLAQLGAT